MVSAQDAPGFANIDPKLAFTVLIKPRLEVTTRPCFSIRIDNYERMIAVSLLADSPGETNLSDVPPAF